MGVGRIFSRGDTRWFFQNFYRGAKSGEICFFPLETKKTTFFAKMFKIQGGQGPPAHLPSDVHAVQSCRKNAVFREINWDNAFCKISFSFCISCTSHGWWCLPNRRNICSDKVVVCGSLLWKDSFRQTVVSKNVVYKTKETKVFGDKEFKYAKEFCLKAVNIYNRARKELKTNVWLL